MAKQGKTLWDGISGLINFLLFGPPLIFVGFFVLMFPESVFEHFTFWLIIFLVVCVIYWILIGMFIKNMLQKRRDNKHQRELELARAKGRAFRGEDDDPFD